jgi:hypothetical protein
LDGLGRVFGSESPHNQCQLAVGRCLYRSSINPLDILNGERSTAVHSHNKLCRFHGFLYLTLYMLVVVEISRKISPALHHHPGGPKMNTLPALICSLLLTTVAFAERPPKGAEALVGTWRLVDFADLDKDGKWQHHFGEHPRGYFVYDATGHVHIQIMKVPALKPFPEANIAVDKPPTPEHALAAYNAYVAYFGTYTVEADKHLVTHHVEGSLAPDFTDTDQPRPFKLEGDRLEIGDGKTWRRVLERVR